MSVPSNMALAFPVRKHSDRQLASGSRILSLVIEPEDVPVELLNAPPGTSWTLAIIRTDENGEPIPANTPAERPKKTPFWEQSHTKIAVLLCEDIRFQNWMNDNSGCIVTDPETCKDAIYRTCDITSRSQLPNQNWLKIVRHYRDYLERNDMDMLNR